MKKETGAVPGADGSEAEQFSQMRPAALCSIRTFTGHWVGPCEGWLGSSRLGGGCRVVVGRKASWRGSVELAVNVLVAEPH